MWWVTTAEVHKEVFIRSFVPFNKWQKTDGCHTLYTPTYTFILFIRSPRHRLWISLMINAKWMIYLWPRTVFKDEYWGARTPTLNIFFCIHERMNSGWLDVFFMCSTIFTTVCGITKWMTWKTPAVRIIVDNKSICDKAPTPHFSTMYTVPNVNFKREQQAGYKGLLRCNNIQSRLIMQVCDIQVLVQVTITTTNQPQWVLDIDSTFGIIVMWYNEVVNVTILN